MLDALNELLAPHIFPAGEDGATARTCPTCGDRRICRSSSASSAPSSAARTIPNAATPASSVEPANGEDESRCRPEGTLLGKDPETGEPVTLQDGRFGPYVQLGKSGEGEKPSASSLPKGSDRHRSTSRRRSSCWRCRARSAGIRRPASRSSPDFGRYGPFVQHDGTYANLESVEDVFTVGLNRAVDR